MFDRRLHPPAMVAETIEFLRLKDLREGVLCDMTLGTAGHALAMLEANPNLTLVGIDQDGESLTVARSRLESAGVLDRCRLVRADYRDLNEHLDNLDALPLAGALLDAGWSLWQLDDAERGFSFRSTGRLDMRLSRSEANRPSAEEIVNESSEDELVELLVAYGEELPRARKIVRSIHHRRLRSPLHTPQDLVAAINAALAKAPRRTADSALTRTFAALRSAVNDELGALADGLRAAAQALAPSGRLVVLTYSSGEDRTAKSVFAELSGPGPGSSSSSTCDQPPAKLITPKPITPSRREIVANPRARGAKLRCLERAGGDEASK